MINRLSRVALALILWVCARPSQCIGQSAPERCEALLGQYVGALREEHAVSKNRPEDSGSPGFEQRFDQWEKDDEGQWQKVIDAGRKYLGGCTNGNISTETNVLESIGEGLKRQGKAEDAIPILRRCVSIDPDNSSCWDEIGTAEMGLCQFDAARSAFQKVIQIGGFNELNALLVDAARSSLSFLQNPKALEGFRTRRGCPARSDESPSPPADSSGDKRFGTGFFVNKQGYILTNSHVVEGCKTLATRDGKILTVVDRDAKSDLALLKADAGTDSVATFRSGPFPKPGDAVIAFGFPLPDILSSEGNVSTGVLSATAGLHDDIRFVQISAPVQPGNSGGPLLDPSGHVVGVVVAKLDALRMAQLTGDVPQNINFAVHWSEVRAFLDEKGIDYRRAPSVTPIETRNIAAEAKRYSVGIDCTE